MLFYFFEILVAAKTHLFRRSSSSLGIQKNVFLNRDFKKCILKQERPVMLRL
jgi:hypothetical protein